MKYKGGYSRQQFYSLENETHPFFDLKGKYFFLKALHDKVTYKALYEYLESFKCSELLQIWY